MSATAQIHARVAEVLVEALNADEDVIRPGATRQGDLGAELIDFLDIVFRLEREFGIRIPRGRGPHPRCLQSRPGEGTGPASLPPRQ